MVLAFVVGFLFVQWWDLTLPVPRSPYQAVFLVNGQTYFGRYFDRIGAYVKIEDPYYIQQVPDADPSKAASSRLVRRGNELHGPAGPMLIPRDSVLFVEDLAGSSPIAQFMAKDAR